MNKFSLKDLNAKDIKNDNIYNNIYIPERFRNVILKHLILNYSNDINNFSPPLLLSIQGTKGEGKSFMIKELCNFYSIDYIPISGSELCGSLEGDSTKKIISEYESACIRATEDRKFSCIVIDDFHKSIAAHQQSNLSRTTNSETLVGCLMNLCDNPYKFSNRIPIILTGNNFTSVYSALTRHSRMDFFDWAPTLEEKTQMVYYIFKKYYPNIDILVVKKFVEKYKDKYIAFFKSVVQDMFWGECNNIINAFHNNRNNLNLDNITDLVAKYIIVNKQIDILNILSFAEKRSNQTAKNFE